MKKNLLFARANLRKAKGQTAAIIMLILLSSMMMNLWLMLALDYRQNYIRAFERLNDGHVTLALCSADEPLKNFMNEALSSSEVIEYNITDALCQTGSYAYNGGNTQSLCIILEKETALSRKVGKCEITEDSGFTSGIYLPMILGTGDNYSVGDTIHMEIGTSKLEYTVCGFINSLTTGSNNCGGMCSFLLTKDKYEELAEKQCALDSLMISLRLENPQKSEDFETRMQQLLSEKFPDLSMTSNAFSWLITTRYISQGICSGIMCAMAFFVLLIALVVTASNVMNYIHENMPNLGALKAIGYTGRQLLFSLILQFSGIAFITSIAGTALSYCIFPAVNELMIAQTGIPYTVRFLPAPCFITLAAITGVVAVVVYCAAKRMKKIDPITAVRQGITTHNFKKNHVPLDTTALPLNMALAMKTACSGPKQNIIIFITMFVLSLVLVFSGVMFQNVISNADSFTTMIVGETTDTVISISTDMEQEFLKEIKKDSRLEKIHLYNMNNDGVGVTHVGGLVLSVCICDDCSAINNKDILVEGRFPEYDNETAIGISYAKKAGLKLGDEITLSTQGQNETYLITGFTQISNFMGRDCLLTRKGYEKMGSLKTLSYYINLKKGTDIDAFNRDMTILFPNKIISATNFAESISGFLSVYITLMTIIVVAILIVSALIITFVLYLLNRMLLNQKEKEYGILKALGYTTKKLVLQTALGFMPTVIFSTVIGILISMQIINPLISLFLGGVGIVKSTLKVPVGIIIIAGSGLVLFTFAVSCLMSLKIRKNTPQKLLTGE